jgi:hypothetical protein
MHFHARHRRRLLHRPDPLRQRPDRRLHAGQRRRALRAGQPARAHPGHPRGGTPQTRAGDSQYRVNTPRTFYSRYLPANAEGIDARQPLPATFFARWISGFPNDFETHFKIWREGRSGPATACSAYPPSNGAIRVLELVRFDEEENPETFANVVPIITPVTRDSILPSAARVWADNESTFPPNTQGAGAGWMYLNLDDSAADDRATQNWVISSMRAAGRFSTDTDATALGNGCSAPVPLTNAMQGSQPIGPAPNVRP